MSHQSPDRRDHTAGAPVRNQRAPAPHYLPADGWRLDPNALPLQRGTKRVRLTTGRIDEAVTPDAATDAPKIATLLRRYLTGTTQRTEEIRAEIRRWYREQGQTPPI